MYAKDHGKQGYQKLQYQHVNSAEFAPAQSTSNSPVPIGEQIGAIMDEDAMHTIEGCDKGVSNLSIDDVVTMAAAPRRPYININPSQDDIIVGDDEQLTPGHEMFDNNDPEVVGETIGNAACGQENM